MAPPTEDSCCRGLEGLELWGPAVNWGSDHRLPSAATCCASCKAMCNHEDCAAIPGSSAGTRPNAATGSGMLAEETKRCDGSLCYCKGDVSVMHLSILPD
ncbi:hypothetical protein E2562_024788 [Oryza meyeriana var. granulata]|uniref:Uncharacterized protein n=1 Tax=Oryza meyeriana var. granulata TaxID=110450 RepID=A0A6G1E1F6_9ORYZ|nr:hypothetical protein E2562_024788 [Oryza meyeriana var. granulata]